MDSAALFACAMVGDIAAPPFFGSDQQRMFRFPITTAPFRLHKEEIHNWPIFCPRHRIPPLTTMLRRPTPQPGGEGSETPP